MKRSLGPGSHIDASSSSSNELRHHSGGNSEVSSTDGQGVPQRVSLGRKATWGVGGAADNLMMHGVGSLLFPIYNVGLGLDAVLVGLAQTIPRAIDTLLDPLIGHLSDNTRTRWGRRRPYVLVGAVGCALLFPMLWSPTTGLGQTGMFVYLLIVSLIYYFFYTLFVVPYTALGFEQSKDPSERTHVLAWRMYFGLMAGLAVPWLYRLCFLPVFGGEETVGVIYVGVGVAILIAVVGTLPAIFCSDDTRSQSQAKMVLPTALAHTFKNREFLVLMAANLVIKIAWFLAYSLTIYVNIYYVCGGDKSFAAFVTGLHGTVIALMGYIGLPLVTYASNRMGNRGTLNACLVTAMLAGLSSWWTFSAANPYLQIATCLPLGIALNGMWLLLASMVGDACDADEAATGLRREGMYSGVFVSLDKIMFAIVGVGTGMLLTVVGFDANEVPSDEVIWKLRLAFVGVQGLGMALAIAILRTLKK